MKLIKEKFNVKLKSHLNNNDCKKNKLILNSYIQHNSYIKQTINIIIYMNLQLNV